MNLAYICVYEDADVSVSEMDVFISCFNSLTIYQVDGVQ